MGRKKKTRGRRGDGSLFLRKDGRWQARVIARTADGKRAPKSEYAATREEGKIKLESLRQKYRTGVAVASTLMTVDAFSQLFMGVEREAATKSSYRSAFDNHILPYLGTNYLARVTDVDVQKWLNSLSEPGEEGKPRVGARTRQIALSVLSAMFDSAKELHLVLANPVLGVKRPKATRKPIRPFRVEETCQILEAVRGDRLEALFMLAFTCGMRQGELFGLQWEDINFDERVIVIQRKVVEVRGKVYVKAPKTETSFRTVGLTPECVAALQERRKFALMEKVLDKPWVFLNRRGGHLRRSNFANRVWKPLLRQLGFAERGMHHSRHTTATIMLNAKLSATVVAGVLGHANPKTTLEIYGHLMKGDEAVASRAISRVLKASAKRQKKEA